MNGILSARKSHLSPHAQWPSFVLCSRVFDVSLCVLLFCRRRRCCRFTRSSSYHVINVPKNQRIFGCAHCARTFIGHTQNSIYALNTNIIRIYMFRSEVGQGQLAHIAHQHTHAPATGERAIVVRFIDGDFNYSAAFGLRRFLRQPPNLILIFCGRCQLPRTRDSFFCPIFPESDSILLYVQLCIVKCMKEFLFCCREALERTHRLKADCIVYIATWTIYDNEHLNLNK